MIIMIIKNGLVVDPALGLSEKMDLAIENGTILKIEKTLIQIKFQMIPKFWTPQDLSLLRD